MKRKIKTCLEIVSLVLLLSACGNSEGESMNVEHLSVGEGVAFQSERIAVDESISLLDIVLLPTDLEGLTKENVQTKKESNIYGKPSQEAGILGTIEARANIEVFGLCEDAKWMIVEYNGRVAYIQADAFENQTIEMQTTIVPTRPTRPTITDTNPNGSVIGQNPSNDDVTEGTNGDTTIELDSSISSDGGDNDALPGDNEDTSSNDNNSSTPGVDDGDSTGEGNTESPENTGDSIGEGSTEAPEIDDDIMHDDSESETPDDSEIEVPGAVDEDISILPVPPRSL